MKINKKANQLSTKHVFWKFEYVAVSKLLYSEHCATPLGNKRMAEGSGCVYGCEMLEKI